MRFWNFKHWEFWPSYMFYLPNIPYAAYLTLKAKNLTFFSATNPAIKHSGNGSESKFSTLQLIPNTLKPASIFIESKSSIKNSIEKFKKSNIEFPLIVKPDIGFRGLLVKKIETDSELANYLIKYQQLNLIIQEFVDYNNECGIFYHRVPNETKGKITSITLKKYLTVKGNGILTLKQLIEINERAKLYIPLIKELNQKNLDLVIENDKEFILNVIGNHSKGTEFVNGNHLISSALENTLDSVVKQIPGFYYGRLDIKYNNFEDLIALKNLKIIEINGIISEPTHIYDPRKISYFKALKEIRKHWKLIYKIATLNHKINKVKYDSVSDFVGSLKQLKKYTDQTKKLQN